MSAKLSWGGGPLSFVVFAVLLFILTVLGFILEACEAAWRWIRLLLRGGKAEPAAPTPEGDA